MHRRILGAGLALAALLAGKQATQPQPFQQAKLVDELDHSIEVAKQRKPAPTKPAAPATAQRRVTLASQLVRSFQPSPLFRELPQRRKVKRGKYSWVII